MLKGANGVINGVNGMTGGFLQVQTSCLASWEGIQAALSALGGMLK